MTPVRGAARDARTGGVRRSRWLHPVLAAVGVAVLLTLGLSGGWSQPQLAWLAIAVGAIGWSCLLRALARAERRNARMLQSLGQVQELAVLGTWRWRVGSPTIEWGGESARIYGLPAETRVVALEEVQRRMHPDDLPAVLRWMEAGKSALPDELVGLSVEYRVIRDDGSICWVMGKVEAEDLGDGRTLIGVQQDITPQVMDRERLRLAQEIARIGDWEWDLESGRIRWSETMYAIYGLDPATYVPDADNVFALIQQGDRERVRAFARTLAETGARCEAEFRIVRPDGDLRVIHCIGMREIASGGRVVIRSIQQDVTDLALARDRLVETEAQYRFLFEHNPLPMWVFDRETLAFLAANDAMSRHYGYSREEILERNMLDIRPEKDRAAVEVAARLHAVERPQGRIWTHLRKDGSRLRAAVYTHDIVFNDRPARLVAAQDVTEREASEQRFQLVARATSDAIYDLDVPTGALWWSDTMYAAFGYARGEIAPTVGAWEDMIHPEDREQALSRLYAALRDAGQDQLEMEYRLRRGDGTHALVVDRGFFVREGGMVVRMVGSVLDVTEKRRQDADLRLLRRAVEATQSGILIADLRAAGIPAVYVNKGFEDMTGFSAAEILGRDSRVLDFDPRDVDRIREIRRGIGERRELRTLVRMRRKDGSVFWNDFYMAPVLDDAGQVTHMVSVSTDVTERQRSEERFQLVARATSDAVWDWDLARDETWRSDNVYPLFGYAPGEIAGSMTGWSDLLHPDDLPRVQALVAAAIKSGTGWECEYRLRRKDGTY
ncbi:MAG: PAS domain S-box protein, partial [Lysobacteraceae bacterium]